MNWNAVANGHHYDVRFREQGSSTWTTALNNISGLSIQKTQLTSSTTYEWEVRSACSAGNSSVSAWSSTQTLTTLTPCTKPLNATTTAISLTSATLTWDAVAGAWGYIVRYKASTGARVSDTTNTNSYTLSGLTSSTFYKWKVLTMCSSTGLNNSSGYTSNVIFATESCNNFALASTQTNVVCN